VTERIGTYEILRPLARGGMSMVFLVRQPALDREAVLKRLKLESDDPGAAQHFVNDSRLAAGLSHPNIVTLFDFFEDGGVPYIAMEYVGGGSLRPLVGSLGLAQVFGVLEGVLAGLAHAESRGVVHRDLKPENVLLSTRGTIKIADFGIARAYSALAPRLTSTGTAMGTPTYMAPEQALTRPLGPYTDLYALGVMAYELLAGRPPFTPVQPMAVLYAHVNSVPPPLAELAPGVPAGLAEWVHRLLAKAPTDRPASAGEAWEALEEIAVGELGPYWRREAALGPAPAPTTRQEPAARPPPSTATREAPTRVTPGAGSRRRRRLAVVAAVPAAAAAAALVALAPWSTPERPSARPAGVAAGRPSTTVRRAAPPYDFSGDGRQEAVIALPRGTRAGDAVRGGVVLVQRRGASGDRARWRVVTERAAGLRHPSAGDAFGTTLASADFDRDGHADLVMGAPGRNAAAVLYGAAGGILAGRRARLAGPRGSRSFGYTAIARDFDGDRFADLVVTDPGRGAVELLFGSRRGLREKRHRIIRSSAPGFGTRVRGGDVDGDGHPELVEGAPDRADGTPGHLSYCPGTKRGPVRCHELPDAGGTSSLAVADTNGDGFADIVQGDAGPSAIVSPTGGEVRLWLGGKHGPRRTPITVSQNTRAVPGIDEPGDAFGATVDAGDVDGDGYADVVIGAPGENLSAGSIVIVRGGRLGFAVAGHTAFSQNMPGVPGTQQPGHAFGESLALMRLSGRSRPDLVVAAPGARPQDARIFVIASGPGLFAPGERRIEVLGGVASLVRAVPGAGVRIGHVESG
jgi:Protein kinase domain/FG-GAP-like repeat/FG-GAP repeat